MLDKSIPYYNLIMKYRAGTPVPAPALPAGCSFRHWLPGDERAWAGIEAAVGEFDTAEEALRYFEERYLPNAEKLRERCLFVLDGDRPVATCTAWWDSRAGQPIPSLHWVGVHPAEQGRGLGRAVVLQCMRELADLEPGRDVWLHTQSWSYRAIGIYLEAGFEFTRVDAINDYVNEYALALPVLEEKMLPRYLPRVRNPL